MTQSFPELRKLARRGNVIPVTLELSSDLLTPVSAYLRLASETQRSFLLESVEGGERLARYSFLGVDPFETLIVRGGTLEILPGEISSSGAGASKSGAGTSKPSRSPARVPLENPFTSMGKHLARYRSVSVEGLPPFCGGAVGFVGYECVQYLEKIPRAGHGSRNSEKPESPKAVEAEVAEKLQDEVQDEVIDACLMVFRDLVAFDHVKQRVILVSNIFTEVEGLKDGFLAAKRRLERLRKRLLKQVPEEKPLPQAAKSAPPSLVLESALGRPRFEAAVRKIQSHIRAGDIFQAVLSDQFTFKMGVEPFAIYRALRRISPAPYLFYLNLGNAPKGQRRILLGASPEMLTKVVGDSVETCPIAGTRKRGVDAKEDKKLERSLLDSVKEKAEHLMLVDLGRNDIGRVSRPGSVQVRDFMHVERFSHVMHLVSHVEGKLASGKTAWDALGACFPAGTLSGAPKIRAMQLLSTLEPVPRGPYGGAVVYYDFSGRFDSCIAIRSLSVTGNQGVIQAGAGIVADSNPAREYDEVLNKTRAIRSAVIAAGGGNSGKTAGGGKLGKTAGGGKLGKTAGGGKRSKGRRK